VRNDRHGHLARNCPDRSLQASRRPLTIADVKVSHDPNLNKQKRKNEAAAKVRLTQHTVVARGRAYRLVHTVECQRRQPCTTSWTCDAERERSKAQSSSIEESGFASQRVPEHR
jgi:hypothetical protein